MKELLVLVHSPLVGPLTWAPVSRELRQRGIDTVVPVLTDTEDSAVPFWLQHATAVARRLESVPPDRAIILVGHSGAGPLLPAIAAFSPHPVTRYIFVDAGLPHGGRSRLEEMAVDAPEFASWLRQELEEGGRFPRWTDEELREIIPDEGLRQGVLAELHPRPLAFFEQIIPSFHTWPGAPCAYLKLSEPYAHPAEEAQHNGWAYTEFNAGHFHMLVDPEAVAEALIELGRQILEKR
jgi:pimeloyl-ACP methyl ester carboxylesterase